MTALFENRLLLFIQSKVTAICSQKRIKKPITIKIKKTPNLEPIHEHFEYIDTMLTLPNTL